MLRLRGAADFKMMIPEAPDLAYLSAMRWLAQGRT
jgi:hypothetical protein